MAVLDRGGGADRDRERHAGHRAQQHLLAEAFDVAGADVGVVARERLGDLAQADGPGEQARRIGLHQELLLITADGVDVGHARDAQQLRGRCDAVGHLADVRGDRGHLR